MKSSDDDIATRYIAPAAAAIREQWILGLMKCGVSREVAERWQREDAEKIRIVSCR